MYGTPCLWSTIVCMPPTVALALSLGFWDLAGAYALVTVLSVLHHWKGQYDTFTALDYADVAVAHAVGAYNVYLGGWSAWWWFACPVLIVHNWNVCTLNSVWVHVWLHVHCCAGSVFVCLRRDRM
jgi:hypothetical protein